MPKLTVFDPSMCCSSGVCGPSVDLTLVRFAEDLERLRRQGVEIQRYNLARETWAFAQDSVVRGMLGRKGTSCLPLILVDGKIVSEARYLPLADLAQLVGLERAAFQISSRAE